MSSSRRPSTTSSHIGAAGSINTGGQNQQNGGGGGARDGARGGGNSPHSQTSPVVDRVGSMRKRLSMLKIGKKGSKTNVRAPNNGSEVSSVIEE